MHPAACRNPNYAEAMAIAPSFKLVRSDMAQPRAAAAPYRSPLLRRDIAGFTVTLLPAFPYEVTYVPDHHVIGFTFERQEGVDAFAADRHRPFRADPWRLAFTPAGCEV